MLLCFLSDVSVDPVAVVGDLCRVKNVYLHCHSTQPLREHWRDVEPGVEHG